MLAYVETLCVDGKEGVGQIDRRRVRCNSAKHPLLSAHPMAWDDRYSTRLAGFFDFAGRWDTAKAAEACFLLIGHDDWDCLDDLEAAGFVEILSLTNGLVKMTRAGNDMAARLRAHKTEGGHYAGFRVGTAVAA